jgi:hypothetical protein
MAKSPQKHLISRWSVQGTMSEHVAQSFFSMESPMPTNLSRAQIVRGDEGAINKRIVARVAKVDYRRIEAASIKMAARFTSAEGKRLFLRYFSSLQLHVHFISVIARLRLEAAEVEKVEEAIRSRLDVAIQSINEAIDGADALFQANGITTAATYDTEALDIEVAVISSFGRRYLEAISKLDQLMPLLQTLEIYEIAKHQPLEVQRALLKRQVREVAHAARNLASGLRRRLNILAQESAEVSLADGEAKVEAGDGDGNDVSMEAGVIEEAAPEVGDEPPSVGE